MIFQLLLLKVVSSDKSQKLRVIPFKIEGNMSQRTPHYKIKRGETD
jgi:hypothetical protein